MIIICPRTLNNTDLDVTNAKKDLMTEGSILCMLRNASRSSVHSCSCQEILTTFDIIHPLSRLLFATLDEVPEKRYYSCHQTISQKAVVLFCFGANQLLNMCVRQLVLFRY